ncbi:Uncharacterized protein APZ42_027659 [Daphnia magna]|uniref:Uncharacterized protein n=1 Tax=Daphnia magna TaxID=35525 RepID=A0A164R5W0_9CRUS|nr:Uncharacterized protein APZ42_027659 [Daphnia magna]
MSVRKGIHQRRDEENSGVSASWRTKKTLTVSFLSSFGVATYTLKEDDDDSSRLLGHIQMISALDGRRRRKS